MSDTVPNTRFLNAELLTEDQQRTLNRTASALQEVNATRTLELRRLLNDPALREGRRTELEHHLESAQTDVDEADGGAPW